MKKIFYFFLICLVYKISYSQRTVHQLAAYPENKFVSVDVKIHHVSPSSHVPEAYYDPNPDIYNAYFPYRDIAESSIHFAISKFREHGICLNIVSTDFLLPTYEIFHLQALIYLMTAILFLLMH